MNQESYEMAIESLFFYLENKLSNFQSEIDWDIEEGGLNILFQDGSQLVITPQRVIKEVWIASKLGAQHFRWTGQRWQTSQGEELWIVLNKIFAHYHILKPL